jgi:hypothetical protein
VTAHAKDFVTIDVRARTRYYACVQTDSPIVRRLVELERSQGWLARKLGVTPPTVNRWIKGALPILPNRQREIALALNMPVGDVRAEAKETVAAA